MQIEMQKMDKMKVSWIYYTWNKMTLERTIVLMCVGRTIGGCNSLLAVVVLWWDVGCGMENGHRGSLLLITERKVS
jgi:hypothetical protein